MKPALTITLLNFICSFVVGFSLRVFNQGRYVETAVSDAICLTLGFVIVRKIAEANTKVEQLAYVVSGVAAFQFAIFVTKAWYGV